MKKLAYIFISIFTCVLPGNTLFAQNDVKTFSVTEAYENFEKNRKDSTAKTKDTNKVFELTKSPGGAVWRSLVLPGWGQYYVGSYWRAPVFLGAALTLGYLVYHNNSEYNKFSDQFNAMPDSIKTSYAYLYKKSERDAAHDNRDISGMYLMGVYLLATIDAYVGAHLYDFDVNEKMSFGVAPSNLGGFKLIYSYKY